jgi:hypothetical protein
LSCVDERSSNHNRWIVFFFSHVRDHEVSGT